MLAAKDLPFRVPTPEEFEERQIASQNVYALRLKRYLGSWCLLVLLGFVAVTATAQVASMGYRVDRLQTKLADVRSQHAMLSADLAAIASPMRLASLAQKNGLSSVSQSWVVLAPAATARTSSLVPRSAGSTWTKAGNLVVHWVARILAHI